MAQLRDARTSELLAEGTPLEVVLVAKKLGLNAGVVGPGEEVGELDALYDNVTLNFNPQAVLDAYDSEVNSLNDLGDDAPKGRLAEMEARAANAKAQAKSVDEVLQSARSEGKTDAPVVISS